MMTLRAPQHYQQAVKIVCLSIIINFVITPVTPIDPFTSEKVDDGCSLRHEVLDVVVCEEEVSCNVPLHKSAVLMCPGQSGKWVYSNSTVSLGESSNLTLTRVHFNDSGSYHYDSKIPCNFIVSVGEPPMVTAPQLHDRGLGCYQLPQPFFAASTDVGLKIICNTTSKDIKWYMSNDNNMDRVPATGVNNKQVYSLPLFYGKENTIEMFTCVVTNLYGNTTLTYVINITQAPTDNDAIYEKVKAKSQEVNCTKGKDMMLFYEMKFYASFSLAKFCFFPKGSYNPLFKFMDSNSSTCCVCQVTNCTKCNNITKWTISITQHSATFIFTLHLKDVNPNNYGLYTMTACVYQVDVDSCGSPAWTEIKMCKHADEWNTKLVLLVGGCVVVTLVFLVVMVKYIIPSFCYCYFKSKKKRNTNLYAYKRLNSQDKTEKESIGPSTTNLPKTNSKHETKTDGSCEDSTVASNKDIKSPCTPISATGTPDVLSDNEQHLISKQMQPHPLATARDGIVGNSTESSRKYKPPYFEEASNENQNSCGQVFIIYCKDDNPPVEELSYWLRHNCGIDSDIDAYHSIEDIVDWNQWTEKKINDCCDNGYILLLCGKNLYQLLQKSSGNDKINMHHGFIGTLALRNLIQDKSKNFKFLPVFFDHENEAFLPSELKSRSRYIIHTDTIKKDIGCKNPEAILKLKVNQSFSTLIYKIIGQKGNVKPSIITCSASYDTSGKSSLTAHNESEKLVLKKASNDV